MKKTLKIILLIATFLFIGFWCLAYFALKNISQSYIRGDVPDTNVFDQYLLRDLSFYFSKQNSSDVKIQYSLLRDSPTQVGVGSPKFYVWVKVIDFKKNNLLDQGVVVVGANDGENFTVIDFVSKKEIDIDPEILTTMFPEDVVLKIRQKVVE